MKYLLDSHVLIWLAQGSSALSLQHRAALCDRANHVHLSVASIWELAIKADLGKLRLPVEPAEICAAMGIRVLDISVAHVQHLRDLPKLHRDPFDRILVATARAEGLTLVTHDESVLAYPVSSLAV